MFIEYRQDLTWSSREKGPRRRRHNIVISVVNTPATLGVFVAFDTLDIISAGHNLPHALTWPQ